MLVEVFLNGLFGFADVDGEEKESFGGEVMTDFIDESGFFGAEAAPGGPEFQKNDFSLDGGVIEFFAGGSGGVEARGRLFGLGNSQQGKSGEEQRGGYACAEEDGPGWHEGDVNKRIQRLSISLFLTCESSDSRGGGKGIVWAKRLLVVRNDAGGNMGGGGGVQID